MADKQFTISFPSGKRRVAFVGDIKTARATVHDNNLDGSAVLELVTDSLIMAYRYSDGEWAKDTHDISVFPESVRPTEDSVVVLGPLVPHKQRRQGRKPASRQPWAVSVSVQGRNWTLTGQRGKDVRTSTGVMQGTVTPGLATVLATTVAALKTVKGGQVTVSLSDANAAAILRGEKRARKTAALADACRTEIERLNAKVL